ncbi:anthranilate synthase component I [Nitrosococcus oceani]|uniref:Anthranilate synthase component 1 n=2 Tax=Nitrosococcus oceani TaxID=1229 RepID=Q3J899_NITOC|nr:anthranilate synthase component I [Nitrosococcus oceani]KFI18746.1 anthranilate synthase component I [Nitrosococcus oceani C-27]ABA58947.1 anthranilate synthase, component I [Nitrosococcus oceani ATCC 19707]EDZ68041.1 anthranilate synthase component I [Nitrosococcus oceani AFC27]KFI21864.1 anthranilate synthase component I [Nitrosococcus oceani]GEM18957.1 anthranilate synthase component I [Nitrosococcus oceani]
MEAQQFKQLAAQGYNHIPLMREVLADLDTPLSTYLKLANGPYSYLLESVHGGEKWGRYSFIGLPCRTVVKVQKYEIVVETDHRIEETHHSDDPLAWIETFKQRFKVPAIASLPRFTGGLVGYFGYDTIRYIEPKLAHWKKPDSLETPDILLLVSNEIVVFDNLSGKLYFIIHCGPEDYTEGLQRLDALEDRLRASVPAHHTVTPSRLVLEDDFISGFTEQGFKGAVDKTRQYITDGDVMQVVLSQRLSVPFSASPLNLYRALRCLNPSPYMYYLNLEDFHVVGSSPEILVRLEDGAVTVRPIAGTRHRGRGEEEDRALEQELLADPKELAEHRMLIDLGRNDVGRIATIGSVNVTEKMLIERYSHVMHIVSNVTGQLKPEFSAMDVLRATFPAGTVSGAPKIRAMEIIDELEPIQRGVYAGAVGYLAWSGNMDTAIAIRTAIIKDQILHIQAGAGIVYDSVPQSEWEETLNKGRAIFRAVALAEAGLDGSFR